MCDVKKYGLLCAWWCFPNELEEWCQTGKLPRNAGYETGYLFFAEWQPKTIEGLKNIIGAFSCPRYVGFSVHTIAIEKLVKRFHPLLKSPEFYCDIPKGEQLFGWNNIAYRVVFIVNPDKPNIFHRYAKTKTKHGHNPNI